MYHSILYNFNVLLVSDTSVIVDAINDSSTYTKSAQDNFLGLSNIQISPVIHPQNISGDIITYVVISLIGIISIILFFLPDKFLTIFSFKPIKQIQRDVDSTSKAPGKFITSLFWINFIVSLSIFLFLTYCKFFSDEVTKIANYEIIFEYIIIAIASLFLYRFVITYLTGYIFQTEKMMKQQIIVDRNIQLVTGVLLLPIILLMQYASGAILIFVVMGAIALLQVYRMAQIVIIGNSSPVFSTLHIILYLCTLEIVPILILLRLISNDSGI